MSPPGPRSYLFALIDGGGSVPPELAAVRQLVARGHHIEVLAEDSMRDDVRAVGAPFRPWVRGNNRPGPDPKYDPIRDWECRTPFQLINRLLDGMFVGPAPGYTADLIEAIECHRPDRVVCSFLGGFGAMVGAEAAGVPYDVLIPNIYMLPARGMPPFGLGTTPAGTLGRICDRAVGTMVRRQWNKGLGRINALRKSYGLKPIADFWDEVKRARKVLVLTSPSFDFPAQLPENVRYVGAVLDDPRWAADEPWAPPPGDDPLVLLAMSSTFQDQAACLQRVIDALTAMTVRGIVTTGPALDPKAFRAPSKIAIVASAPHSEVLKHANVVVTHGGHGTVVRSLAAGVPLVVMPQGRDQADNAARVIARGAGVKIKATVDPDTIAAAVRHVLDDPSYREAAARLGQAIRADAESDALITELVS
jgi:MGT family glycosyltransferase